MTGKYTEEYYKRYSHYIKMDLDDVPLFHIIKEFVQPIKGKILDIGCGLGYLLNWIFKEGRKEGRKEGVTPIGLDFSQEAIAEGKKLYPEIGFIQADIQKDIPLEENSIDCILFVNIIEHLTQLQDAIKSIKKVLKKDGLLIVSTVEKRSLYKKIWIHDPTHIHEFTREELLDFLAKDFEILDFKYTNSVGRFNRSVNYLFAKFLPCDVVVKCVNTK